MIEEKIPYPVNIEVDPVDGICNNKCFFCFYKNNTTKKQVSIKTKPLFEALEIAHKNGTKSVELVGGSEPTMHKDIDKIVERILELGLELGIVTNGLLLNRISSVSDGFKYIRISLDAGTSEKYFEMHGVDCFEKVVNNIIELTKNMNPKGIGLSYLCLPQNNSKKEMVLATKLASDLKLGYIVFRPAIMEESSNSTYLKDVEKKIMEIKKTFGKKINVFNSVSGRWKEAINKKRDTSGKCLTCALTGIIKANGDIPFCNLMRRNESFIVGNIYEKKFDEIWGSKRHIKLFKNTNIKNCPLPCKADDYRRILFEYKKDLLNDDFMPPKVNESAHKNFI